MRKKRVLSVLLLLLILLANFGTTAAQEEEEDIAIKEGVTHWIRHDVNLTLQQNSGLAVEEINEVALTSGVNAFTTIIPTDKLNSLDNVQVLEIGSSSGQRGYVQADTKEPYTFQVILAQDKTSIILYFPPNTAASTTLVIRYFVTGAVRFYDTGDRLEWRPYGAQSSAPVNSSTITVNLPPGFTPEQLQQHSTGIATEKFISDANRAIFQATNIPVGSDLEVSMSFPHGVIEGAPSPWQRTADALDFWTPVLRWVSVTAGLILLFLGPLAAYGWWYTRLRVAQNSTDKLPKYIKSPPGTLSPAVAGVLLDEKCIPRHLSATLLDLAYRGAIHVYPEQKNESDYLVEEETDTAGTSINLYGVDQKKASRPYEETTYTKIFGFQGGKKRTLADVRQTLFMSVPETKKLIEAEVAKAGIFPETPGKIRRQYLAFGGAVVILSMILALLALAIFSSFTFLVVCPFLGITVGAIAFIIAGFAAPKRTKKGEQLAVRWKAFRRYLKEMDISEAEKAQVKFSRLLPYAVTFGVDKGIVNKFATAKAPAPKWWSIPAQKLPNVGHENAHAWVSADHIAPSSSAQLNPEKPKAAIRRLGTRNNLTLHLKDVQVEFEKFLHAVQEAFSKAPALDDDQEIDFDAIDGKK